MATAELLSRKEIAEILGKTKQAIKKMADKESWSYIEEGSNGGTVRKYPLTSLPPDVQAAIAEKRGVDPSLLPALAPEAALKALDQYMPFPSMMDYITKGLTITDIMEGNSTPSPVFAKERAVSERDLRDQRIKRILAILRDVDNIPPDWPHGKRKWVESVAMRHQVDYRSVYRWAKKYEKRGIAGLRHSKSTAGSPKKWTPEAIDFWVGLCLKREHRKIDRRDLFDQCFVVEANNRGWKIGDYSSALWWYRKRVNPQLEAMQRGGIRALDNVLPPIMRRYNDLAPFEILVGDQHRFNFWVVDDFTGEVFRPEGYLWQDLRTRAIYGAAVDRRYDAWLIGLALRIGIHLYGAFGSIYTDNGRPECSRYLTGILANMHSLGMSWKLTEDTITDIIDIDAEEVDPCIIPPGTHRKAIVKNAKAKMIEGTFNVLEGIMSSHLRLPGNTKRLTDDIHWQDVDQQEALSLAKQKRLLTMMEFALQMYLALDYYNKEKPHRGVQKEWVWKPRPSSATPYDCIKACCDAGWSPRMVSRDVADLIFLARASRVVDLGRITFRGEHYEHDALIALHKKRLNIRYNPMDTTEMHCFLGSDYICTALPVTYSSMKDTTVAQQKIIEKRERRKMFSEEFKKLTLQVPDFRQYSRIPEAERVAALIGEDRRRRAIENKAITRQVTQEELDRDMAIMEAQQNIPLKTKRNRRLPERPGFFRDSISRYIWIIDYRIAGGTLNEEDEAFKAEYEANMTPDQLEYWQYKQQMEAEG